MEGLAFDSTFFLVTRSCNYSLFARVKELFQGYK